MGCSSKPCFYFAPALSSSDREPRQASRSGNSGSGVSGERPHVHRRDAAITWHGRAAGHTVRESGLGFNPGQGRGKKEVGVCINFL